MKKVLKSALVIVLAVILCFAMTACGDTNTDQPGSSSNPSTEKYAQGVDTTNHTITVGNTAVVSGAFAGVGEPFKRGMEAYFYYYNNYIKGYKDPDGNAYTINYKHYDDGFDGATGATYTEKLVEQDKVFALAGHFGSNTVAATIDYIEEKGIPMVYAVTGLNDIYDAERNVFGIQPIYYIEGKIMLATSYAEEANNLGLGGTKVGVIATTDETGTGIKEGVVEEQKTLGKKTGTDIFFVDVDAAASDYTAAVNTMKNNGCDVVIIAAAQDAFKKIANAFVSADFNKVKILTSYISGSYTVMYPLTNSTALTNKRTMYTCGWLYTGSAPSEMQSWKDYVEYNHVMAVYAKANGEELDVDTSGWFNETDWYKNETNGYSKLDFLASYTMAGYIAAYMFCQGLERCDGKVLTWDNYIDAMENGAIHVPMGDVIDFSNGRREGITNLTLTKFTGDNYIGELMHSFTKLEEVEAAVKK